MRLTCPIILFVALPLAACHPNGQREAASFVSANRNGSAVNAAPQQPRVDLNTASAAELMQLPGIGEVMSRRIIEHRERHGPFRRPAEVIIVEGFSEKKYRAIADLVRAE